MYIESSVLNHSCRANAFLSYRGIVQHVRVLEPIPAGAEITVYYDHAIETRDKRIAFFRKAFFFTCRCPLCETGDPEGFAEQVARMHELHAEAMELLPQIKSEADRALARKVFNMLQEHLKIYRSAFGSRYSPYHTRYMIKILEAGTRMNRRKADMKFLKSLLVEAKDHVRVTFGPEHFMTGRYNILETQICHGGRV